MSDYDRGLARPSPLAGVDMAVDAGLRTFMLGIYNKVALGLMLSAALAFVTSQYSPLGSLFYRFAADGHLAGFTGLGMAVRFAPIAVLLVSIVSIRNPRPASAAYVYWAMVVAIGAGLGLWLVAFTAASLTLTFLITSSAFGVLSLVGYTTKKDLTGLGSFLIMGVWGLLAASLVSMFWRPAGFSFVISMLGVLIFAGLIAYDTQRLKMTYHQLDGDQASLAAATNYGALRLYINFINLFQFLLAMSGSRR